jgi:hypothetical protein
VKRVVVHSLVNRAKVICQNQKDFNNEIKAIHDLMLSKYPNEFVDSIMKPSARNHPTSDTVYQGTVVIPYGNGISDKFRRIGNRLSQNHLQDKKYTPWDTDENRTG